MQWIVTQLPIVHAGCANPGDFAHPRCSVAKLGLLQQTAQESRQFTLLFIAQVKVGDTIAPAAQTPVPETMINRYECGSKQFLQESRHALVFDDFTWSQVAQTLSRNPRTDGEQH